MTRWAVVGAGAAGCVVADRLARSPGSEVVLLEAGAATPPDTGDDWFVALGTPGRTFPGAFRRGRGVGGSTAVNGMVATVGPVEWYGSFGLDDLALALAALPLSPAPPRPSELGPVDRALLAAAPDAAVVPLARRLGRRVSAADALLGESVSVRGEVEVARVVVDGGRVVGVESTSGEAIDADRVVLTAGAVGTPLLLAASGLGGPDVGRALQNHVGVPVTLRLRPGVVAGSLVTGTHLRREDLEVVALNHLGADAPGLAMLLAMVMTPTGRGSVRLGDDGVAVVDHLLSDHDRVRAGAAVELVRELLTHGALADIVEDIDVGEPPAGVFHPTSTCAIGSVVDPDGAVPGVAGLHVADASVLPSIPPTHTMLPTMLVADHLARRMT